MKCLFITMAFLYSGLALANPDIDACLKAWGKHPFGQNPSFRKLAAKVKVLGIGGTVKDMETSSQPELILVKHSVSVMSKQTYQLMNPNGWYCLKGAVAVLGKSEINIHCKAHLASTDDGTAVAASNDGDSGVAVLGKIQINRSCP